MMVFVQLGVVSNIFHRSTPWEEHTCDLGLLLASEPEEIVPERFHSLCQGQEKPPPQTSQLHASVHAAGGWRDHLSGHMKEESKIGESEAEDVKLGGERRGRRQSLQTY